MTPATAAAPLPATTPASTASAGPDVAALVDRLVEAQQAARNSSSAQIVQTAIVHSEFGQVSLRFNQSDQGMTVAMSSADPGFSRAAQAALGTVQPGSASAGAGDGSSGGQQSAGSGTNQNPSASGQAATGHSGAGQSGAGQSGAGPNSQQNARGADASNWFTSASGETAATSETATSSASALGGIFA